MEFALWTVKGDPQVKQKGSRALSVEVDLMLHLKQVGLCLFVDLWSGLLEINVQKSRKRGRERCHFVFGGLCL